VVLDDPEGVVTWMSTVPVLVPAGAVAWMVLSSSTWKSAAMPPKVTLVAPLKELPVMTTTVPPVSGPLLGLTALMLGALAAL
jgi:hypothetical protein